MTVNLSIRVGKKKQGLDQREQKPKAFKIMSGGGGLFGTLAGKKLTKKDTQTQGGRASPEKSGKLLPPE